MAQLDKLLALLSQPGARELRLSSGAAPLLVTDLGQRPASSARPNPEQTLSLLSEVLDPLVLEALKRTGAATSTVRRPGLPSITGAFHATDALVEAVFRPASDVAPPPPGALSGAGRPIDELFRLMIDRGASDLHLSSGERPAVRIDGDIVQLDDLPVLEPDAVLTLVESILPELSRAEFQRTHDTDFAHELPGAARFRCNVFVDRKGPGAVFRVIPSQIRTAAELGLPESVLELCQLTRGLVLVTGPTGSGKSTTLTALVDHCNTTRRDHIITIEDPIEFIHENRRCLINQREVRIHTESFKRALRAALREDPDIVLIGELRDLETIAIALETAETGHLVFATLHTTTAIATVDRIIEQFPPEQQAQVRTMLADALRGVISQVLCRRIGGGRVAAMEVLIGVPAVSNLIREGKTFQIPSLMQTGKKHGMWPLNDALADLVRRGLITPEEGLLRALDKTGLAAQLRSAAPLAPPPVGAAR